MNRNDGLVKWSLPNETDNGSHQKNDHASCLTEEACYLPSD